MSVHDPSSLIEERVKEELEPLRQRLEAASDDKERRRLRREMRRVERKLRKSLSGPGIAW
jgi:hypothetical protein